jgi:hypothetical protein
MPWFILLEKYIPADFPGLHIMHCPLDDIIPFCEWFVMPYLLWFLYIPAIFVFLFYHSKNEFYRICAYEFTGMTIALLVCTFYPNGLELRLSNIGRENILIDLVHFLYNNDTPTNVFPSLHVYVTISAHICLVKSPHMQGLNSRKHIKVISLILAILICMSTLFLKQHSVLDVLAGTALAFILYFIVFKWWFRNTEFPAPKIDPKQHQVLYFLNKRK